jgi:hypothetical protein
MFRIFLIAKHCDTISRSRSDFSKGKTFLKTIAFLSLGFMLSRVISNFCIFFQFCFVFDPQSTLEYSAKRRSAFRNSAKHLRTRFSFTSDVGDRSMLFFVVIMLHKNTIKRSLITKTTIQLTV